MGKIKKTLNDLVKGLWSYVNGTSGGSRTHTPEGTRF